MAERAENLGRDLARAGHQDLADQAFNLAERLKEAGVLKLPRFKGEARSTTLPESPRELRGEWEKQAKTLAKLYATPLGLTEGEYMASLPPFFEQPESFKGRFNTPLIVPAHQLRRDNTASVVAIAKRAGLDLTWINDRYRYAGLYPGQKYHLAGVDGSYSMGSMRLMPYTTWVDDGSNAFEGEGGDLTGVNGAVSKDPDLRGQNLLEGIALYIQGAEPLRDTNFTVSAWETFIYHHPSHAMGSSSYEQTLCPVLPSLSDSQKTIGVISWASPDVSTKHLVAGRKISYAEPQAT